MASSSPSGLAEDPVSPFAEDARYHLAIAPIRRGDVSGALRDLATLDRPEGPWAAEARRLRATRAR